MFSVVSSVPHKLVEAPRVARTGTFKVFVPGAPTSKRTLTEEKRTRKGTAFSGFEIPNSHHIRSYLNFSSVMETHFVCAEPREHSH